MTEESTKTPATTTPARPPREIRAVENPLALYDTGRFEHMMRIATTMASASLCPQHLIARQFDDAGNPTKKEDRAGTIANCFRIVNQAERWGQDPFALADAAAVVNGRLVYEGKAVAAAMDSKGIARRYEYFGEPGTDSYGIRIWDKDDPAQMITGTVADWKTRDRGGTVKSIWIGEANQARQLKYRGDREHCRRWHPSIIMGVLADDEVDAAYEVYRIQHAVDITPRQTTLQDRLTAAAEDRESKPRMVGAALGDVEEVDDGAAREESEAPKEAAKAAAAVEEKPAAEKVRKPKAKAADEAKAEPALPGMTADPRPAAGGAAGSDGTFAAPISAEEEKALIGLAAAMAAAAQESKTLEEMEEREIAYWQSAGLTAPKRVTRAGGVAAAIIGLYRRVLAKQTSPADAKVRAIELIEDAAGKTARE